MSVVGGYVELHTSDIIYLLGIETILIVVGRIMRLICFYLKIHKGLVVAVLHATEVLNKNIEKTFV